MAGHALCVGPRGLDKGWNFYKTFVLFGLIKRHTIPAKYE